MILTSICAPALIYIGFSLIQIFIDIYNNSINEAFLKFIFMLVFTLIINILCDLGYVIIAWIVVLIPIIMMTIISTLLLQVFGLDPKNKQLQSRTQNARDLSGDYVELSASEKLNQQKYAYYYDKYEKENRIDRDQLRYKFYDDIDKTYKLPFNSQSIYDLSNNPKKFFIADKILNYFGEYSFIRYMNNSQLYHTIFSSSIMNNNTLFNNYIATRQTAMGVTDPYVTLSITNPNTNPNTINNPNKYTSYNNKYSTVYKVDGYDLFKRNKYDAVKRELESKNPRVSAVEIEATIEAMWKKLSAAEQNAWNTSTDASKTSEYALKYDHKDLTSYGTNSTSNVISSVNKYANNRPCPVNETPITYKAKTGLVCYELCPPGRVRNAAGDCTTIATYSSTTPATSATTTTTTTSTS
jgi:hypothetical protein